MFPGKLDSVEPTARKGFCLVLCAASGGGKSSVADRLKANDANMRKSISATTRTPREGEINGVHYQFLNQRSFDDLVTSGGMLEHATVFGRSYGIPRAPVETALEAGVDLVFAIDWQGYRTLKEKLPGSVVGVFLLPPSEEELESRLRARGDREELIISRMAQASDENSHAGEFEHAVVNDDFERAMDEIEAIVREARADRTVSLKSFAVR